MAIARTVAEESEALGFDVELTRDRLLALLLIEGKVPEAQLPTEPDESMAVGQRDRILWKRARAAAMVHAPLHSMPCKEKTAGGEWIEQPRCLQDPCRISAVSYALLELCEWWEERSWERFAAALAQIAEHMSHIDPAILDGIEETAAEMREAADLAIAAMNAKKRSTAAALRETMGEDAAAPLVARLERSAGAVATPLHEIANDAFEVVKGCRRAMGQAHCLSQRVPLRTRSHHQRGAAGPGRPKQSLLASIEKNLKLGKLEIQEIAELVPTIGGAISNDLSARKARTRQRVRDQDLRTIRPDEMRSDNGGGG